MGRPKVMMEDLQAFMELHEAMMERREPLMESKRQEAFRSAPSSSRVA